MNILVAKNGSQLGPFSESDIRAKLASGEFAPTDFGWKEGMSAWSPLSQMFAETLAPASYPPQGQAPASAPQPYNAPQGQYSAPGTYNSPYPSPYQQGAGQPWGAQAPSGYAGFWLRFVALIIDLVILFIVNFCIGLVLGIFLAMLGGVSQDALNVVSALLGNLVYLIYYVVQESSSRQATVGKMAMGLKVTDLNGNRISLGQAIGRHLGKYISSLILGIGFLMAGFTERKQALHDLMAGTLVVKK